MWWEGLSSVSGMRDVTFFCWPPHWNMVLTGVYSMNRRERIPPWHHTTQPAGSMRMGPFSSSAEWISVGRTRRVQVRRVKGEIATHHKIVTLVFWLQWPWVEKGALASCSSTEGCVLDSGWRWVSSVEHVLTVPVPTTTTLHCSSSDALLRLFLSFLFPQSP